MTGEFDIGGVFAASILIWGLVALGLCIPLRRMLAWTGVYRLVWHRGLFDIALLVLVWAGVCAGAAAVFPLH